MVWNCRGYRKESVEQAICDVRGPIDIIMLVETWVRPGCQVDCVEGYTAYDLPRSAKREGGRAGGGLAILVKGEISDCVAVVKESACGTRLWIKISHKEEQGGDMFVCLCYLPPTGAEFFKMFRIKEDDFFQELMEEVADFMRRGRVMVVGDLNARVGELPDFLAVEEEGDVMEEVINEGWAGLPHRTSQDGVVNARGRNLLDFCKTTGMGILNGRAKGDESGAFTCQTGAGSSVVDYVLTDYDLWSCVQWMGVEKVGFESDHRPIIVTLIEERRRREESSPPKVAKPPFRLDERKWEDYKAAFNEEGRRERLHLLAQGGYEGEEGARVLQEVIIEAAEEVFARNKGRKGSFPANGWYDEECKEAKRKLRDMVREAGPESNLALEMERSYKRLLRRKKRGWSEGRTACLVELAKRSPARFWRSFKKTKKTIGVKSTEKWERYCRELYGGATNEGVGNGMSEGSGGGGDDREGGQEEGGAEELNLDITTEEVDAAVKKLKSKKSADRDSLTVELLRLGVIDMLLPPMTVIFNKLFKGGAFPSLWNVGLLHPIFKKGDQEECSNYRTVTVISLFAKIYSTLLEKRIATWAEREGIRARGQAGFRKKFGTAQHLFTLRVLLDKVRGKSGKKLYCCFVDFSKAFDTISREKLWMRLREIGICGNMLQSLRAMYADVNCQVVTPEGLTNTFPSTMGVKQGCPLSPLLFGLYLDKLEGELLSVESHAPLLQGQPIPALMYADDVLLMSSKREGLQALVSRLEAFCDRWQLQVNLDKTKIVVFGANVRKETKGTPVVYKGAHVEIVEKYHYLGLDLYAGKRFKQTVQELCTKAKRASFALQQRCGDLGLRDPQLKISLFDTLVTTVAHYGCEVWCPGLLVRDDDWDLDLLEKLQRTFLRGILGVRTSTPSTAVLGEFGRWPLALSRWKKCISFYNSICDMQDNSRIVKLALLEAVDESARDTLSWFASFKRGVLCLSDGKVDVDVRGLVKVDLKAFLEHATQRYLTKMRAETGTKLKLYAEVKIGYEKEDYIGRMPFNPGLRKLAQFRCGSHDLEVEKGRHSTPFVERPFRLCRHCDRREVEDEAHFVFTCPLYSEIRLRYQFLFSFAEASLSKFLNHSDRDAVGHFLVDCFRARG
eukprot:TRINITY_DN159_c0_g2_i4.p1 TRINITY_DN159_c0_g2~~TRINITY_DN159_c0_g2_i4.p1  ORF type:complete len:1129 (+),score=206.75 TRINITY_DN159_c0_g2_i4:285-3671(+)